MIASRVLRTWGESESGLNERLDDVIDQLDAPATRRSPSSPAAGRASRSGSRPRRRRPPTARRLLDEWEREIRGELGALVFGVDDDTMESVVLDLPAAGAG